MTREERAGFDLHLHTTASDGAIDPVRVLADASAAGLAGISITDHDTIDAYGMLEACRAVDACRPADAPRGGEPWVLPGVEISTSHEGTELHILGYFPGGPSEQVHAYLEGILAERVARVVRGVAGLRERGIDIRMEDCRLEASGRVLSRRHVAQALARKRYVGRQQGAYARFLGPETFPIPACPAVEVIDSIGALGGVSVWAHPEDAALRRHLTTLRAAGLQGLEVHTPRRPLVEREELAAEAAALGLLVTGGSDWHGHRPRPRLGRFRVAGAAIADFLQRAGLEAPCL